MVKLWKLLLRNPIRSCRFIHAFVTQVFIVTLKRALLPGWPHYQSYRLQLQRCYWASSSFYFPEVVHRLPVTDCPSSEARRVGLDWSGYVIPGTKNLKDLQFSDLNPNTCIAIYAHGGCYARGEARMYLNYMKRWTQGAAAVGLDITFLSVEYPLSDEAPHPAQREAFLKAYQYVLDQGIPAHNVIFMGDSAGGGLCVLSAFEAKRQGLPQPAGSVLISPWMDMALRSHVGGNALAETDYVAGANLTMPKFVAAWLNGVSPNSPDVNPLCRPPSDFKDLNPFLIMIGGGEFALHDGKDLAALCEAAGLLHHLEIEWGQLHLYALGSQWVSPEVRQKTDAMIYRWIRECLDRATAA
ncbi:hypothetical protein ETB97_005483 [Aspergillus alliaceus]|uniref:Alpha/beta hydrolase fold-3 domain-containing protein n=1 Tax=Petromyces alliaceus TaxID=209559 RepID=A0A8H6A0F8_PETAA|nr:hypothetical protein ETB97_005483 [Aspergillus burnettii]